MSHDTDSIIDTIVHYIPKPSKPRDPALCGIRWINGSDKVTDVTCPMCIQRLQVLGNHIKRLEAVSK